MSVRRPLVELFETGRLFRGRTGPGVAIDIPPIAVRVDIAGYLQLPTGRLVARDSSYWVEDPADNDLAFREVVEAGVYRVDVSVAQIDLGEPQRLRAAAVRLVVRDEPTRSWSVTEIPEYSAPEGEDPADYGFVVDSGQACYLDHAALPYLKRIWDTEELYQALDHVNTSPSRSYELVDTETGLNLIVFDCGIGAGSYTTWLGRNDSGEITCFVTDFELLFPLPGPSHTEG
jgi:hypothetical protein